MKKNLNTFNEVIERYQTAKRKKELLDSIPPEASLEDIQKALKNTSLSHLLESDRFPQLKKLVTTLKKGFEKTVNEIEKDYASIINSFIE